MNLLIRHGRVPLVFWWLLVLQVAMQAAQPRPNIVWVSAEDISPHLGCYGDPHAITPNLDQLAKESVRYSRAFTTAGVCAPCRSGIITGMYQTTIGTHHMRSLAMLPDHVRPFPAYLRQAGYYTTNNSKQDYQFITPQETWDESSPQAHWRGANEKQPFFAVFNFTGCHESGIAREEKYQRVTAELRPDQRQNPDRLTTLPPYGIMRQQGGAALARRLTRAAVAASSGEAALAEFVAALEDEDPAVRYWGAIGMGHLGENAITAVERLRIALGDESGAVRIAAAQALCRMGIRKQGLNVLAGLLSDGAQWERLQAAIVLDELDQQVVPVLDSIRAALTPQTELFAGGKYTVRVIQRALLELETAGPLAR